MPPKEIKIKVKARKVPAPAPVEEVVVPEVMIPSEYQLNQDDLEDLFDGIDEDGNDKNDDGDEGDSESPNEDVNTPFQKLTDALKDNIISDYHTEVRPINEAELRARVQFSRNYANQLHKTIPLLTKYEKARIIGERAKQLEAGAIPLIEVDPNCIDAYTISLQEFNEKKIPFIIKRPLPNGEFEYWKWTDLECCG